MLEHTRAASRSLGGTLSFGFLTGMWPAGTSSVHREPSSARYPRCRVEVIQLVVADLFGQLRSGDVDLMAAWLPHGHPVLVTGPSLTHQRRVVVVARDPWPSVGASLAGGVGTGSSPPVGERLIMRASRLSPWPRNRAGFSDPNAGLRRSAA